MSRCLAGSGSKTLWMSTSSKTKDAAVSLTTLLVPTYRQMLTALSKWLAMAQAQLAHGDAEALLAARLAPDMFPLSTQIRFACVQAWEGVHRLKGDNLPDIVAVMLDDGRDAGQHPGTIADAQARIGETLAMLDGLARNALDADPNRPVEHALPMGMVFDLTAEQYARDWTLPQFYFHLMTAYAIMRAEGLKLGKADYVAHMFAYLRPGTMPTG